MYPTRSLTCSEEVPALMMKCISSASGSNQSSVCYLLTCPIIASPSSPVNVNPPTVNVGLEGYCSIWAQWRSTAMFIWVHVAQATFKAIRHSVRPQALSSSTKFISPSDFSRLILPISFFCLCMGGIRDRKGSRRGGEGERVVNSRPASVRPTFILATPTETTGLALGM